MVEHCRSELPDFGSDSYCVSVHVVSVAHTRSDVAVFGFVTYSIEASQAVNGVQSRSCAPVGGRSSQCVLWSHTGVCARHSRSW